MLFGKIQEYYEVSGGGMIKPENGDANLHFERSAVRWGDGTTPKTDRRLSYEIGKNELGGNCAVRLQPA